MNHAHFYCVDKNTEKVSHVSAYGRHTAGMRKVGKLTATAYRAATDVQRWMLGRHSSSTHLPCMSSDTFSIIKVLSMARK